MKKYLALTLVIALVMGVLSACGGGKEPTEGQTAENFEPITLRMATDAPVEFMGTVSAKKIIAEIEEKTEGRIKIDLYPTSQLGDYATVYDELVRGTIDIAHITIPDALDSRMGAPYTPYMTSGYEEAKIILGPDGWLAQEFRKYNEALGVKFFGFYLEGYIGTGTVKEPKDFLTPGAEKGLKIRVWNAPASRLPIEDLGYTAISIPYAEAPTSIQTGVVDGWIGGTSNANYHYVGDVIKNFYMTYMNAESTSYVMSKMVYDKLLPQDQKIVEEAFVEESRASFDIAKSEDEKWMAELEKKGVKVTVLTPEQVQVMADYIRETTWPKLEEVYSKELLDGIKAELDKL